ncbi:hypothetical protein [Wolbachia endosymbiont of Folsomia candida]|uniref:hypothetical protein n=1 Tax=Wolbachia endosymbiont of Folsomia candida TaxID=169402 RepID=UPI000AAB454F|nr:hypothetical protein [Wolbachia endosymbiont of Folsomia candida]APR98912.1 hypothetical protein ASM33_06890 [Wolbachia endosymbiont of Folsomia candida]
MLDILCIEGVYCTDDQCDVYTGEVSVNEIMSGEFNLRSRGGEEAKIELDMSTFNIGIDVNDQNGQKIRREVKGDEFIMQRDGSLYIDKDFGSDKLRITIK